MIGAAIGAGVGIGSSLIGGGLQAHAAYRRGKAMRRVLGEQEEAINREEALNQALMADDVARYGQWAAEDQVGNSRDVDALLGAGDQTTQDPTQFLAGVKQAQAANPVQGTAPLTAGQAGWAANAGQMLQPGQDRFARALSRDWSTQKAAADKDAILTDRAIRRLMAQRDRADGEQRRELERAIQKLAWARQQRALQSAMNRAAAVGGNEAAIGGLVQGLGSSASGAIGGMSGGGGAGAAPAAAPTAAG
jgi:hypothetical protein